MVKPKFQNVFYAPKNTSQNFELDSWTHVRARTRDPFFFAGFRGVNGTRSQESRDVYTNCEAWHSSTTVEQGGSLVGHWLIGRIWAIFKSI